MPRQPDQYTESRAHFAHYAASAVAAVFCIVLLYQAAREARGVLARHTEGQPLVGTVTSRRVVNASSTTREKRTDNHGTGSTPIEYTVTAAYQGRAVRVVNRFRNYSDQYPVGSRVPLVYVPSHPEYSRVDTPTERYGQLLQLAGFGLLSGFAAALLWLRKRTAGALFAGRSKPSGTV